MRILLDTHLLLWALSNDPKLSGEAREFIENPKNEIFYSAASIWEIEIKHNAHPTQIPFSGEQIADWCEEAGFVGIPLKIHHIFYLGNLSRPEGAPEHKDPFDRILLCQAKTENLKFLTHDSLIPYYQERNIISV